MDATQLKSFLHQLIDEVNDIKTLEKFKSLFNAVMLSETKTDWWDDLNEHEKKDFEEAFSEMDDESNWVSHKEVMKLSRTWLKK